MLGWIPGMVSCEKNTVQPERIAALRFSEIAIKFFCLMSANFLLHLEKGFLSYPVFNLISPTEFYTSCSEPIRDTFLLYNWLKHLSLL